MIVKRIGLNEFIEAFKEIDRDYFSYEGYEALYEYLEELSDDIGQPLELDPVAIACDFSEYESLEEIAEEYGRDDIKTLEDLGYYTTVIEFNGGVIIQDF